MIKIFLFHRVSPLRDSMWDPMDPKLFEQIIRYLSKQYLCVKLEDYFRNKVYFQNSKKQLCAIVFDDGYKDFLEYALPILKKHNVSSSMYIVTDCVNSQLPPWTYQLDYCFNHSKHLTIKIETDLLPTTMRHTTWANNAERIHFGKNLKPILKKITNTNRLSIFNEVVTQLNDVELPKNLLMNWAEINEIITDGVEVGSHTHSHPLLASIEDDQLIKKELSNSFELIKENCGIEPYTISYPIGSYDARVMSISKEVGYKIGLAVDQAFYNEGEHNIFAIPRVELYNEPYWKAQIRISGLYQKLKNFVK